MRCLDHIHMTSCIQDETKGTAHLCSDLGKACEWWMGLHPLLHTGAGGPEVCNKQDVLAHGTRTQKET